MQETVGADLREKLENPLKFQWGTGGADQPPTTVYGFDATLLIDLCKAITSAQASGKLRNPKLAQQASVIINASAKSGIQNPRGGATVSETAFHECCQVRLYGAQCLAA